MQFQVKNKKGVVRRELKLIKTGLNEYLVIVDRDNKIGTMWKAEGRINQFSNHRLVGTRFAERWFARTAEGKSLGKQHPYEEGFSTRFEALTELLEEVLKLKRDWR